MNARFTRFVAIDWSGARGEYQKGIAVAQCGLGQEAPRLVTPPGRAWSRGAALDWIVALAEARVPALIGLDLSPALPFADRGAYFSEGDRGPVDMPALWAMIEAYADAEPHFGVTTVVDHPELARHFRRHRACGDLFQAGRGRLRLCETRQLEAMRLSPSSCFNLVGAAQVGKSSLTGMRVLHALAGRVPLWPLDPVPAEGPLLVEIYTSIAARAAGLGPGRSKLRDPLALDRALAELHASPHAPIARYDDHATDALLSAAWLRRHAGDSALWHPEGLTPDLARTEGWTFGVR
ncbi:hypothetical protein [Sphingomonas bacterium]|uniref:hypothetical protein n=1 Tax=Sphingomonas bacterium TaxID=1895847 RepID=UPI0015758CB5|nr:hypothetical protein [Sphingomonas bacterium]